MLKLDFSLEAFAAADSTARCRGVFFSVTYILSHVLHDLYCLMHIVSGSHVSVIPKTTWARAVLPTIFKAPSSAWSFAIESGTILTSDLLTDVCRCLPPLNEE